METQILAPFKSCPWTGVNAINQRCREVYNSDGKPITLWSDVDDMPYHVGFYEGDKILFTRNDWNRGVMNGSLGLINHVYDAPVAMDNSGKLIIAIAIVDEEEQPIYVDDVDGEDPVLDHGYAITVHRAQGSQFPRVIVPVRHKPSMLIDMTWVYTAITRGIDEVILVGSEETLRQAVARGSRGHERVTGFKEMLLNAV